MKRNMFCAAMVLVAGSLLAADKDDVSAAIAKLSAADNYSWKTTTTNIPSPNAPAGGGGRGRGRGGFGNLGMDGKAQKDGLIYVTMQGFRGGNPTEAYIKASKGAIKAGDADWTSLEDAAADQGPASFMANRMKTQKSAADDAKDWLSKTSSVSKTDDYYTGVLTADAVKSTVFAPPGGDPPEITDPKGTIKFWVKDGVLVKYERNVQYKRTFNDNPIDINTTTIVEIKDVGATKIEVPDEAKKKLS
jgi:hypothetical protein